MNLLYPARCRWNMTDDMTGLNQMADMHKSLVTLSTLQTSYSLIQCISFFTLIAKLISMATFQPRMAIVPVSWLMQ